MTTNMKTDEYVWGSEKIIWGFDPSHKYTCKVLQPKKGKLGCLSLQYHDRKSESWIIFKGLAWILVVVNDVVCTKILSAGEIINLPCGVIHRLMGATDDCMVIEPSTPDEHAADKSVKKDVVRLHCMLGREVSLPRDEKEKSIVELAAKITVEACEKIEQNQTPEQINFEILEGLVSRL